MSGTAKKVLATFGPKGARVRLILHDASTVRAEWYAGPKGQKGRKVKDWPNTAAGKKEARAWAKGFSDARTLPGAPEYVSLRVLWEKYITAESHHLRPRTQQLYAEHWRYWERTWGREFDARQTTIGMMDDFRTALVKRPLGVAFIGRIIRTVKRVYKWGRTRHYLTVNPIGDYEYKIGKDNMPESPEEYSQDEFERLMATLDPDDGRKWRAFVGLSLCGWQGVRENAAVHLAWDDVDFETATLTWRKRWDKRGREWTQPMRAETRAALEAARVWRERTGYVGPWVLPANNPGSKRDGTYSPQSLIASLRTAEREAKVPYKRGRGPHGLRRLLAGNVAEATGNAVLAMRSIGDTDVRMANRYLKRRDTEVRAAFDAVDKRRAELTEEKV